MEKELFGKTNITVYTINNDEELRAFLKKIDLPNPNGLNDEQFIKVSKELGGNSFDLIEFEMFWNTGEIPAFCYLRFVQNE